MSATGTAHVADRSRGFTLLELILAIALMGLAVSMAALSLRGFTDARPIDEARELAERIALVHEETGFTGRIIGFRLRDDPKVEGDTTIEFLELTLADGDKAPRWTATDPHDPLLAPVPLDERLSAALEVDAAAGRAPADGPAVLLLPDGEFTPFVLTIAAREGDARAARVVAHEDGGLVAEAVE